MTKRIPHFPLSQWAISVASITLLCICTIEASAGQSGWMEAPEDQAIFRLHTVVIDAGHGGKDPGNVSPWKVLEKDINLSIALKLAKLISSRTEYEVFLTRTIDRALPLTDRGRLANQYPANQTLFISIHCNSHTDQSIHGLESYIFNLKATDALAERLAKHKNAGESVNPIDFIVNDLYQRGSEKYSWEAARIAQSMLASQLKVRDRNWFAPDKKVRRAPFVVLADTKMPAILIELGFLSNKAECEKLSSPTYQDRVAESILAAIQEFDRLTQASNKDRVEN